MLWVIFAAVLIGLYFYSIKHPHNFPPHPKFSLPLIGDVHMVGKDINQGFKRMHEKYGPIFGLWLGPNRAVVIKDFNMLYEMGVKAETSIRPDLGYFASKSFFFK